LVLVPTPIATSMPIPVIVPLTSPPPPSLI
jgi:hypothetical protein